jgi:hypothetical protein
LGLPGAISGEIATLNTAIVGAPSDDDHLFQLMVEGPILNQSGHSPAPKAGTCRSARHSPSRSRGMRSARCCRLIRSQFALSCTADRPNDEFGSHEELDAWNKTFYHRAVQTELVKGFERS